MVARLEDPHRLPQPAAARRRMRAVGAAALAAGWLLPTLAPAKDSAPAAFSTRFARYEPVAWPQLPAWNDDSGSDALVAFRTGCRALARKDVWSRPCAAAVRHQGEPRLFFEQHFDAYQVTAPDRGDQGTLTGYFEPLLRGSRMRRAPYVHPVYETPADLLYLDARELAAADTGATLYASIDGRNVRIVQPGSEGARAGLLRLEVGAAQADARDRRIRVQAAGGRIVPYPSRQEIERQPPAGARVLAWVDSAEALYVMQVQGSGRILLPDGSVMRVAYAEQNGHPFLPKIDDRRPPRARARGIEDPSSTAAARDGGDAGVAPPTGDARDRVAGNGSSYGSDVPSVADARPPAIRRESAEVQRLIDYFLSQSTGTAPAAGVPPRPQRVQSPLTAASASTNAVSTAVTTAATPASAAEAIGAGFYGNRVFGTSDPSYVFFREIPGSDAGPIGALGVPLTAGRSVAVDPRITPLGAPVFIAAGGSAEAPPMQRLMVAQDTGGAIRGPVRADFFWGFGRTAGLRALQTRDALRMWVMLPKGFDGASRNSGLRTRDVGGGGAAECVIPDQELCVE